MILDQPFIQLNMASGEAYSGAKAYFTQTGTTIAVAVYQDAALTVPHTNPVVANAEGRFPAIFVATSPALRLRIITATGDILFPMLDIDPVSGSTAVVPTTAPGENFLVNPSFCISQGNGGVATNVANNNYSVDQWYFLSQTAATSSQQLADPENGFTHYNRQTQIQVASQRMGFAQPIISANCKRLRGQDATFTPRVRFSVSAKLNYAVIGWTGGADAPTTDVVNNWANASFTTGNFFKAANMSVLGVGSYTPPANVWTTLPSLTVPCGAAFTNIIVFVWTDQVAATNTTLDCDFAKLEQGDSFTSFEAINYAEEYWECLFFYWKRTFANALAYGNALSVATANAVIPFPRAMFKIPGVQFPAAGVGAGQAYFMYGDQSGATVAGAVNTVDHISNTEFRLNGAGYAGLAGVGAVSLLQAAAGDAVVIANARM